MVSRKSKTPVDGSFTLGEAVAAWKRLRDLLADVVTEAQQAPEASPQQASPDPIAADGGEGESDMGVPGGRR